MLLDQTATTEELERAQIELVILPVGAIEQHSGHLPLGTDWIVAQALAGAVAERLSTAMDVYLLPALPFSLSQCHGPLPGTVWLKPQTLADLVRELVLGLSRQGLKRFLLVNGHGGNFVLDAELREINLSYPEIIVLDAAWLRPLAPASVSGRATGGDIHAGEGETSAMLHLAPHLVRGPAEPGALPPDTTPEVGREFLDYAYLPAISPSGVWGQPSLGSAERGRVDLYATAERIAGLAPGCFEAIAAQRATRRESAQS